MKRPLWISITALSMLLLCMTCAMMVRSIFAYDYVKFKLGMTCGIDSDRGCLTISAFRVFTSAADSVAAGYDEKWLEKWQWANWHRATQGGRSALSILDFQIKRYHFYWTERAMPWDPSMGYLIRLPDPVCAAIFAVLPAIWLREFLRRRAVRRQGLCRNCGYDLRVTPRRCPECGQGVAT